MEIVGISLLLATLLILLIYFTVFGAIALPHLPAKPNFLVIWIVFLSVSLGLSTAGIICLLRSGFFKKLRERQVRLQLSELYKRIASLEKRETGKLIEENSTVSMPQGSVTEATTRLLEEPRDVLPRSKEP